MRMKIAMVVAIAGIVVILCMASIAMAETSESAGSQVPGNYVGSYTVPVDSSAIGATALDTGAIEKKIIEQVNAERTSRGLNALTKKSKLTRLARRWSSHMNRANSLHHPGHLPSGVYGQNIAYTYAGMNVNFPCSGGLHYIPNTAD